MARVYAIFLTHTKLILFFDTKITFFKKSRAKSNFVLKIERPLFVKHEQPIMLLSFLDASIWSDLLRC